jgi:hypothetical protein
VAFAGFVLSGFVAIGCGLLVLRAQRAKGRANRTAAALEHALAAAILDRQRADHQAHLLVAMARRTQALLDRQIERLVELERDTIDLGALDDLVSLDHLAVQARRATEAALVASGDANPRQWRRAVSLTDVTRAAVAEVDGYRRVHLVSSEDGTLLDGSAVADVSHLLAELIDGAMLRAAPGERVGVQRAGSTITVRPASAPTEIACVLATRHGIAVEVGPTSVLVVVPPGLLTALDVTALDVTDRHNVDEPRPTYTPDRDVAGMADAAWPLRAVPAGVVDRVSGRT